MATHDHDHSSKLAEVLGLGTRLAEVPTHSPSSLQFSPPSSLAQVPEAQSTQPPCPDPQAQQLTHIPGPTDNQEASSLTIAGAAGVSEIDILAEVASSLVQQDAEQREVSIDIHEAETTSASSAGISTTSHYSSLIAAQGFLTDNASSANRQQECTLETGNECTHPKATCAVTTSLDTDSSNLRSLLVDMSVDTPPTGEEPSIDTVERLEGLLEIIGSITGMQAVETLQADKTDVVPSVAQASTESSLIPDLVQGGDGSDVGGSGMETKDPSRSAPVEPETNPGTIEVQRLMDAMMGTDVPPQTKKRKSSRKTSGGNPKADNFQAIKTHKCPECGKCFPRKNSLNRHLLLHQEGRPFQCSECEANYKSHSQLKRHQRLHSGEKPAKCEHCLKAFRTYNELYTHRRRHTGEKPFECRHCGKCFSTRGYRNTHESIHTGEKKYGCEFCDMRFTDMSARRTHRFTHTGELPYRCEACGKGFTQSGNLRKHVRTVHEKVRPFRCEECGEGFGTKQELQRHVTKVHANTEISMVQDYETSTCGVDDTEQHLPPV